MNKLTLKRKKNILDGFSKFKVYVNNNKVGYLKSNEVKVFKYEKSDVLSIKYFFTETKFNLNHLENNEKLVVGFTLKPYIFWLYLIINHLLVIFFWISKNIFILWLAIFVNLIFLYYSVLRKNSISIRKIN